MYEVDGEVILPEHVRAGLLEWGGQDAPLVYTEVCWIVDPLHILRGLGNAVGILENLDTDDRESLYLAHAEILAGIRMKVNEALEGGLFNRKQEYLLYQAEKALDRMIFLLGGAYFSRWAEAWVRKADA